MHNNIFICYKYKFNIFIIERAYTRPLLSTSSFPIIIVITFLQITLSLGEIKSFLYSHTVRRSYSWESKPLPLIIDRLSCHLRANSF